MTGPIGTASAEGFVRVDTSNAITVAEFRHEFSAWLRAHFAIDPTRLNDVLLAVNEALTNIAEYAYGGGQGAMAMQARYDATDGTLLVDVSDYGTWRHPDPTGPSSLRGRGIPLMRALADRTTISPLPSGTQVQMQFGDCALVTADTYAAPA